MYPRTRTRTIRKYANMQLRKYAGKYTRTHVCMYIYIYKTHRQKHTHAHSHTKTRILANKTSKRGTGVRTCEGAQVPSLFQVQYANTSLQQRAAREGVVLNEIKNSYQWRRRFVKKNKIETCVKHFSLFPLPSSLFPLPSSPFPLLLCIFFSLYLALPFFSPCF